MPVIRIACIVEGHGEVTAVPVLIRRIAALRDPGLYVEIPLPIRIKRDKFLRKRRELERSVLLATAKAGPRGGVFILIDADADCPATLGPRLLKETTDARRGFPISVVLAKHEYESWFLAAARSLRGRRGLPSDLEPPDDPEAIRGAKEWLSSRIAGPRSYSPTVDQAGLSQAMDLEACRTTDSFDKCYREIVALIDALREPPT